MYKMGEMIFATDEMNFVRDEMNLETIWVSDQDITSKLSSTSGLKKEILSRNLVRYTGLITNSNQNINIIDNVKFIPLTLSIIINKGYDYRDLDGLKDTVKFLVKNKVFNDVNLVTYQVEKIDKTMVCIYSPSYKGDPIWISKKDSISINQKLRLDKYYGYQLISCNPLVWYAINEYKKRYKDVYLKDIFQDKELIFMKINHSIPFRPDKISLLETEEKLSTIRSIMFNAVEKGFFVCEYKSDIFIKIYLEIAQLWEGTVINTGTPTIIRTNTYFLEGKSVWYQNTAERILRGMLPKYTLILDRDVMDRVKTSYRQLTEYNSLLENYEPEIVIKNDKILVMGIFGSIKDVHRYQKLLRSIRPLKLIKSDPKLPGKFIYSLIAKNLYEIFFSIESKYFLSYKTYDSFLNIPTLKLDPERMIIPYRIVRMDSIKIRTLVLKLNKGWIDGELITLWGKQVFKAISNPDNIRMSRLMLKKR